MELSRLTKEQTRRRWRELRAIVCDWDPLALMPDAPRDEYDCLVTGLMGSLERGASRSEIAVFLEHELRDHFGSDPGGYDFCPVTQKVHDWYHQRSLGLPGWRPREP
jgi:hypothetical protein